MCAMYVKYMPELPEVQTTVNGLTRHMKGHTVTDVWTDYNSPFHTGKDNIKNPTFLKKFRKIVAGAKVTHVERRAKNILIHLSNDYIVLIHMKMTGHLLYGTFAFNLKKNEWSPIEDGPLKDPFNRFIHVVFTLSNGKHVALSDMRKFAKVTLIETAKLNDTSEIKKLGPEPLSPHFTLEVLKARLSKKPNGKIKSVLMDQEVVAGIGNIYSDEILWNAHVHPEKKSKDLTSWEVQKIYEEIPKILERSIKLGGDSMSDYRNIDGEKGGFHPYHNAYRQHGKKCTKENCTGTIERSKIGGRRAHFCATHQK